MADKNRFIVDDERISVEVSSTITAGDVVFVGGRPGVAVTDAVSGESVDINTRGVFLLPKDASVFAVGDTVYWNATDDVATSSASGNTFIGWAISIQVTGDTEVQVLLTSGTPTTRALLAEEALVAYPVPLSSAYVWDAPQTRIPATPANDDLGIIYATWGTLETYISSGDSKAATTTRYTGFEVDVPAEYVAGQSAKIRINANLMTTVADTSASLDIEVYRSGAPTADICNTAAKDMLAGGGGGGLTATDYDFDLVATNLVPGDKLFVRVKIAIVDAATGTAVIGRVNSLKRLFDIKG
jgi:predicted RecA/RadA family phage recombinase